jgi:hypothetical protein
MLTGKRIGILMEHWTSWVTSPFVRRRLRLAIAEATCGLLEDDVSSSGEYMADEGTDRPNN